jgi:hypothetical protein
MGICGNRILPEHQVEVDYVADSHHKPKDQPRIDRVDVAFLIAHLHVVPKNISRSRSRLNANGLSLDRQKISVLFALLNHVLLIALIFKRHEHFSGAVGPSEGRILDLFEIVIAFVDILPV